MTAVIDIRDLHKHFGHVRALDGLDLTVEEGEIHGFLGPNGAGKTTTIRVLLGTLRATSGHVSLLGRDPWADAVDLHREMAYVPGDVTLWPSLTGGEIIDLLARMRGGIDVARRAELIERFDFDPTKKARTYSKGNRQKVSLISALSSRARPAAARRTKQRAGSVDGEHFPGMRRPKRATAVSRCCCPATSWPRRKPCARK